MTMTLGTSPETLPELKVTLHCTDSPDGRAISFQEIRRWHTDPPPEGRGWREIGYHAVIQPNGELQHGRDLDEKGAHVEGANERNIGICLLGHHRYTPAQWKRLRSFLDALQVSHDWKPWNLYCHHEFASAKIQGKKCPNIDPKRLISWYLLSLEEPIWGNILR